jgi:2-octaprenyl-6-methoxyphenol hydroxylase
MDNPRLLPISMTMKFDTDITIVGGGLNGPILAIALARSGITTTVIDALTTKVRKNSAFDGRSYAVALTSQRLLKNIGLWDVLKDDAQPMLEIKVTDGRAGEGPSHFFMHFDHAEIEDGPMGYMVQDRHLRSALLEAMAENPLIKHLEGQTVTNQVVEGAGVTVTLGSRKTLTSRSLIGCDGRGSGTATRAEIKRIGWGYGQTALVCAVEHEKPHGGIAHQFFMPTGPLAILPLIGNRSSIVWSESEANATAFKALNDEDYLTMLRPRFGNFLGKISLTGTRYSYPLSLSMTEQLVTDRTALVGDAAHGLHPIAGQGLNAGMRDIAALVQIVTEAQNRGEDYGSLAVLKRYEEWRRFDNTALALTTDTFNKLFSNNNPFLRLGRDLGMGLINKTPSLRRGFMREAAGLSGDLPDLMR